MMRGIWLPRTGLLCLLAGVVCFLLWVVGIAAGGSVWPFFILGIASLIAAQVLFALGDILSELRSLHERVGRLETQSSGDPNKSNGE